MQECSARFSLMVIKSVTVLATADSKKILNKSGSGCTSINDCVRVIHSRWYLLFKSKYLYLCCTLPVFPAYIGLFLYRKEHKTWSIFLYVHATHLKPGIWLLAWARYEGTKYSVILHLNYGEHHVIYNMHWFQISDNMPKLSDKTHVGAVGICYLCDDMSFVSSELVCQFLVLKENPRSLNRFS